MDFLSSKWFMWLSSIVIACTIFSVFWKSFVDESNVEGSDVWRIIIKVITFIPLLIIGSVMIAIEKRYWGVLILAAVIITMFVVAFLNDPRGSPAPWN